MAKLMEKRKSKLPSSELMDYLTETTPANEIVIPELDLEWFQPPVPTSTALKDTAPRSVKYAWLGSGQCGGRLVKSFYDLGYRKTLVINTTQKDLEPLDLPQDQKFLMDLGAEGAAKDMRRGEEAVQMYQEDIFHKMERIYGDDFEHIMICVGAGGGTGSGSIIPLIQLAQSYAQLAGLKRNVPRVGVIMTLPEDGQTRSGRIRKNAYTAAGEVCKMAQDGKLSPLIFIDNNKIDRLFPGQTVEEFWPAINAGTASLFDAFNRVTYRPSPYTSFDPTDYYSIISAGGCMVMGQMEVDDIRDRYAISNAIRRNLDHSLLASDFDLSKAKYAGSLFVGGKRIMATVPGLQDSFNYGFDALSALARRAVVHRGIYEDDSDSLRVMTLIGGLRAPLRTLERLA